MPLLREPLRRKNPTKGTLLSSKSLPAPYKGWNARDPEALMGDGYALSMVNCFPTTGDVALRAGAADFTTGMASQVKALLSYTPATGPAKLFASTDYGLFSVVAGAIPGGLSAVPDSPQSNGYVRGINFRTTGSTHLVVVNGADNLRRYDGTAWLTVVSYSIVGGGSLTTSDISFVGASHRRVYFLEKGTADFYTLPVDSIAGSVDAFPLGGLLDKGGSLIAMGSWSVEGGAGSDDRTVFISSMGQVLVYQGTNPTDPDNWRLVGKYNLGEPLGPDCLIKYGGDLLYLSKSGLFPLSEALQSKNVATAISDVIREAFVRAAKDYGGNKGWCLAIDEPNSLLIVNVPITTLGYSKQFVMNLITKAWCSFQGWDAFSFVYHNGKLYMGMNGKVALAYSGLSDFGTAITGITKGAFSYLGTRGRTKHIKLIRPTLKVAGAASVEMAIDTDFRNVAQFGPTNFSADSGALWAVLGGDVSSTWDNALWADDAGIKLDWLTVPSYPAYSVAVRLRFVSSIAKVSWIATDLQFELGGVL